MRGRKLSFVDAEGLRPTPDRVRETLFNWLQPVIAGARCLDLFAGSGALGLEALSRGAAEVTFVERDAKAAAKLEENIQLLSASQPLPATQCLNMTAQQFLQGPATPYDVIFLDPPYKLDIMESLSHQLDNDGWLAPDARIYLEQDASRMPPVLPVAWQLLKDSQAGQANAWLLRGG